MFKRRLTDFKVNENSLSAFNYLDDFSAGRKGHRCDLPTQRTTSNDLKMNPENTCMIRFSELRDIGRFDLYSRLQFKEVLFGISFTNAGLKTEHNFMSSAKFMLLGAFF